MAKINKTMGNEKIGSRPSSFHNQKEKNIDSIKCSPCAKLTIPINPKIKLRPAAINA